MGGLCAGRHFTDECGVAEQQGRRLLLIKRNISVNPKFPILTQPYHKTKKKKIQQWFKSRSTLNLPRRPPRSFEVMVCLIRVIKVLCFVLVVLTYLLIYVIQHSIIKNVTVIPNGPSKAEKAMSEKAVTLPPRVSQLVGSTLETWFRTNLNATPCHSTSMPFLTTSTKEEDKGKG